MPTAAAGGGVRLTVRLPFVHLRQIADGKTCRDRTRGHTAQADVTITPPYSRLRSLVLLVAVAAACLLVPSVAAAATKNCGKQVIADWFDNGRVDKLYPLKCYDEAIDQIPEDLLIYGSAKQDILRALAFAKRGQSDPGVTTGQPTTSNPTSTTPTGTGQTTTENTTTSEDPTTGTETEVDPGGTLTEAAPGDDGDDPSSVPLPLLILGGLAVLLIAAGTAGYIARRRQGGAGGPPSAV